MQFMIPRTIFFQTIYNKAVFRFGFCDIWNNQSRGKCSQVWLSAWLITLVSSLIFPDIKKPHTRITVYYQLLMDQIFREVGSAGARDYRVCTAPGIPGKLLDF